jgi:thiamine-phosphate pyrophosphorylase
VHLPADGLPPGEARDLVGADRLVGRSIHAVDELQGCERCDYVIFGPVFTTPSKAAFGPAQGLSRLGEVARASLLPVLAVGGITASRVAEVLAHGAAGVAVMGAILDAQDPASMTRALASALAKN